MCCKLHYRLEFDIKTNYEDMEKSLEIIKNYIMKGLESIKQATEIEASAKIIKVEV